MMLSGSDIGPLASTALSPDPWRLTGGFIRPALVRKLKQSTNNITEQSHNHKMHIFSSVTYHMKYQSNKDLKVHVYAGFNQYKFKNNPASDSQLHVI